MPALDLALRLRVARRAAHVTPILRLSAIQRGAMNDVNMVKP